MIDPAVCATNIHVALAFQVAQAMLHQHTSSALACQLYLAEPKSLYQMASFNVATALPSKLLQVYSAACTCRPELLQGSGWMWRASG